jgi:hypothetical protein
MPIDRVNIHTASFTLRAANIRGGQLRDLVDALRRAGGAAVPAPSAGLGSGQPAPGAIRSPADQFPAVTPSSAGSADASGPSSGFAPGGSDQMQSLDTNGVMRLIMELLERLLQSIFQMFGQGAGSNGGAQNGGGCGAGAGGAGCADGAGGADAPGTCGGGAGMPAPPPTTGTTGTTDSAPPATTPPRNPSTGGGCGSGRARARPRGRSSMVRRILREIGREAVKNAPSLVPGGAAIRDGAGLASRLGRRPHPAPQPSGGPFPLPSPSAPPIPIRPSASSLGGGTFEERLLAFYGSRVRDAESDIDGAMQQAEGGSSDSRTLASQKVQQLVQKRSELVEAMTNALKSVHESSMSVTRNIK